MLRLHEAVKRVQSEDAFGPYRINIKDKNPTSELPPKDKARLFQKVSLILRGKTNRRARNHSRSWPLIPDILFAVYSFYSLLPVNIFEGIYEYVSRLVTITFYNIRDHFEPIPLWKKSESAMTYLTRIDKKLAIRFIDRQLWGIPDLNLDHLESFLNSADFPEESREQFEFLKYAVETRLMYTTIKEALLNN